MSDFDSVMNKNTKGLFSKLSKEFAELTIDIEEISKRCSDPFFIALLLFQLAKEREQTNKILKEINEKMEKLLEKNTTTQAGTNVQGQPQVQIEHVMLSEVDQRIVALAEQKGMIDAQDVKKLLSYNCLNAASQRLNKLFREGHLTKVRSGKKVFFMAKSKPLCFQHHPTTPHNQSPQNL
jgi:predicted amino acid-binding ACT domain protein